MTLKEKIDFYICELIQGSTRVLAYCKIFDKKKHPTMEVMDFVEEFHNQPEVQEALEKARDKLTKELNEKVNKDLR